MLVKDLAEYIGMLMDNGHGDASVVLSATPYTEPSEQVIFMYEFVPMLSMAFDNDNDRAVAFGAHNIDNRPTKETLIEEVRNLMSGILEDDGMEDMNKFLDKLAK
jgi:hypothetical protein